MTAKVEIYTKSYCPYCVRAKHLLNQKGVPALALFRKQSEKNCPRGFKREYLLDHGMVDLVVPRQQLKATLGTILSLLYGATRRGVA